MDSALRIGLTIDCADPDHVASFWEAFIGYQRRPGGEGGPYVTIEKPENLEGPPHITFQKVPEPKAGKARAHLDLFVEHAQPMVEEMVKAGADLIETTEAGEWTTRILKDPAGNEFCVIGPD